jgi:uncharacterized protein
MPIDYKQTLKLFFSFISGLTFGLGLIVSEMINPQKVLAFLDLFENWDPSLAFVMIGAIFVSLPIFTLGKKNSRTWFNQPIFWPNLTKVDTKLVVGSAIFGAGWGLAGFCPAPALVLITQYKEALLFTMSLLIGMALFECYDRCVSQKK